jgi:hypothetical protein
MALASFASSAQALEVWLASSEQCNTCAIWLRASQTRGYGRELRVGDGAGMRIPILSIDKGSLAADVLEQLPADIGPKNPYWNQQLLVLVMDVARVVAAGNIAESADNNELRHSHAVMFPPAMPADDDPALHDGDFYAEFFASHWNLEYFVDVALGRQPKRTAPHPVDLAVPEPAVLGARNVILWGSAATPLANALFIPTRMTEIRAELEHAKLGDLRFTTLYGHGPKVDGNDTSYSVDGRTQFKRAELHADYGSDAAGLSSVLTAVLHADRARTLLVQVGHSGPTGAPLWGHGLTLTAGDLAPLKQAGGKVVMVSGACNGGQFAKAVQCGFFAAHPDVKASGCQLSPAALTSSDDYLRHFFHAATGEGAAPSATGARASSAGKRGRPQAPSLYDAHWYAAERLEDHQLAYTTTDALIDDFFAAHPDRLPAATTVADLRLAAMTLPQAEADAVAALTAGLPADLSIPLTGYVDANHAADAKLENARELSSAERNALIALPYKLMLPLLARRVAYAALHVQDPEYALAASCEKQSLATLFDAARAH